MLKPLAALPVSMLIGSPQEPRGRNWVMVAVTKQGSLFPTPGKWQPTPVFLPGEAQGQRSLGACRLWGRTESDTTDAI